MTPKKHILFIDGIPDDRKVKARKIEKDGTLRWRGSGSANLVSFLQTDLFNRSNIVFDTDRDQELPRQMIHAVFNQISDPDTHKITLQKAEDFYQHIPKHIPFFNIPSQVMKTTRDNIYRLLQGIDKLHVPKTVKIQPKSPADIYEAITKEGFSFPVIFRQAGDHGGISTIRVDDETEQFYAFALDGRDYYLTQFTEYANEEGIYAKYRLVVVDGEVYLRHVIFSQEWMVHAGSQLGDKESRRGKEAVSKQFALKIKPLIQPTVTRIYDRLGLDYFGIDCHIDKEMNLLVFEINANMNVFIQTKNSLFSKHIEMIRAALIKMLIKDRKQP
jgi:glutathione synthase/RimK-type ligase-like ATP-grasp enzyme